MDCAWLRLAYVCAWLARSESKPSATNSHPQKVIPPAGAATRMYSRVVHGKNTKPRAGQIQVLKARFTQFVKIHRRVMPRRGDSIMIERNKQPTSTQFPSPKMVSPNVRSQASAVITRASRI